MGIVHLAKGSTLPLKQYDKLRLYSMKFCPYVQRVLIVLKAKKLPHDIVYVNLVDRPEWLYKLNPSGKVPVLDVGHEVLVESLDICAYLDETYREPRLFPTNLNEKCRDVVLIKMFDDLISKMFYKAIRNKEGKSLAEHVAMAMPVFTEFKDELLKRGAFFGGERPGMVDYMIWPWIERAGLISLLRKETPQLPDDYMGVYKSWNERMRNDEAVSETILDLELHYRFVQQFLSPGGVSDYDIV